MSYRASLFSMHHVHYSTRRPTIHSLEYVLVIFTVFQGSAPRMLDQVFNSASESAKEDKKWKLRKVKRLRDTGGHPLFSTWGHFTSPLKQNREAPFEYGTHHKRRGDAANF